MKRLITISILLAGFVCTGYAQYTILLDFAGATNGSNPFGSLISDGTFLYGMTREGGTNDMGTIFKIKPDGSGYVKLLDFAGTANGRLPYGSLISDGTFLYGMTWNGGTNDRGTIFKIKPDGSGYAKLLDFAGAANGSDPFGSLISDGTFLYGMTQSGGTGNIGTIFKIMPDGSGYAKLLDFAGAANGSYGYGDLLSDGTFLYGMTWKGGTNDMGTVFKIMPDGSGYVKLLDFAGAANGKWPLGYLISDGTFLYGMTREGGTNNMGVLFKIKPDGSGYVKLLDFAGAANGRWPNCSLIAEGTFLYGMTQRGGTNDAGTLFKIMPDGNGYAKLVDFAFATSGSIPTGSLISDGAFLYGMTSNGATNIDGVLFKYALPVGLDEISQDAKITIYPNPTSGKFTFANATGEIKVYDLFGRLVLETPKKEIDMSSYPAGIYVVKAGEAVRKLVKE